MSMYNVFKAALLALTAIAGVACNNKQKVEADTGIIGDDRRSETVQPSRQPLSVNDEALNAIYPHYVKLTEALVTGRKGDAKIITSNIEAGAQGVKASPLLKRYAGQIVSASSLDAQRQAYAKMSEEYIALVKNAGVKNGELYMTHCPMAFDGKGASWLSQSKVVRNPYMGAEMLTCGEVKETITEAGR